MKLLANLIMQNLTTIFYRFLRYFSRWMLASALSYPLQGVSCVESKKSSAVDRWQRPSSGACSYCDNPSNSPPHAYSSPTTASYTHCKGRCLYKRRTWTWQLGRVFLAAMSKSVSFLRGKTQALFLPVIPPYFLFRFAHGGSPAGLSVVVAATARACEGMDLDGSGNRGSRPMTSIVVLRPILARADAP